MQDAATFGLAFVGYSMLALDVAWRSRSRPSRRLTIATVTVISAHVLLVWGLRFEWSAAAMLDKSVFAFVLFHSAYAALVIACFATEATRTRLVAAGFVVVSIGALPAPFRYEELSPLRLPMLAVATLTIAGICWRPRVSKPNV